ncbi:MAG: hypothetical protein A2Y57_02310 [Candidatus Woykebacteria bacterium RBG_13_40_7b]|uniref:Uncharacterized protein n=1 Tax=Candidatus Woykebacteria bacterium RBG_13_40_7b TaxID=1802594 RepID=A0A1G1WBN6_9BACT|nr:MAG: hypothetical protein A2Y57_02310 [Candidatus Woykebacteria bacterium RBG_13_40_7b]
MDVLVKIDKGLTFPIQLKEVQYPDGRPPVFEGATHLGRPGEQFYVQLVDSHGTKTGLALVELFAERDWHNDHISQEERLAIHRQVDIISVHNWGPTVFRFDLPELNAFSCEEMPKREPIEIEMSLIRGPYRP